MTTKSREASVMSEWEQLGRPGAFATEPGDFELSMNCDVMGSESELEFHVGSMLKACINENVRMAAVVDAEQEVLCVAPEPVARALADLINGKVVIDANAFEFCVMPKRQP